MKLTLELAAMAHGGEAFGRQGGKVYFVPGGLPGERVTVQVVDEREKWARARLVAIESPSADRVAVPRCPHFGDPAERFSLDEFEREFNARWGDPGRFCGGCQWQHIAYEAQLHFKTDIVRDQLARIGKFYDPRVHPIRGMSDPWLYRNQAQFHVVIDGVPGFLAPESRNVTPIEQCLILHPLLQASFNALDLHLPELERVTLRAGINTGEQLIILQTRDDEPPELEVDLPISVVFLLSDGTPVTLVGRPYITEVLGGRPFRITADAFFQVNTTQAEVLVDLVRSYLDLRSGETLLDAYCGVGTFGLLLAEQAAEVILVEKHPLAVADAEHNSGDLENVTLIEGPAESVLGQLESVDAVVVDPPRAGLAPEALDGLTALNPSRIVYVACDPATLARDARRLVEKGYRLVEVQPVDMFPQTYHIECVALIAK